tara:strand:+ start:219 stop:1013 length:795 start_codon:yes stop_codon:yes gene_type:complete
MNFTYYTIIGKDPILLEGHLHNITEYAGFNKLTCKKKLLVIVYTNSSIPVETTNKITEICKKYGAEIVEYPEPNNIFIQNLYACWNLGYQHALDGYVFRGGSDQVFSKDSFISLYNEGLERKNEKIVFQANTVENEARNLQSRHIMANLGTTFEDFDYKEFKILCTRLKDESTSSLLSIEDSVNIWGKPTPFFSTLGQINRTDGCSWMMKRSDWETYGPLPIIENNVTGDVVIHDRLQCAGYKSYITRDCITYHFVRGESIEIQ